MWSPAGTTSGRAASSHISAPARIRVGKEGGTIGVCTPSPESSGSSPTSITTQVATINNITTSFEMCPTANQSIGSPTSRGSLFVYLFCESCCPSPAVWVLLSGSWHLSSSSIMAIKPCVALPQPPPDPKAQHVRSRTDGPFLDIPRGSWRQETNCQVSDSGCVVTVRDTGVASLAPQNTDQRDRPHPRRPPNSQCRLAKSFTWLLIAP